MKRFKWLLIPGIILSAVSGVMLANLDNVSAENNTRVCTSEYFTDKYLGKIETSVNGNVVTVRNVHGLSYGYIIEGTSEEVKGEPNAGGTFTIDLSQGGSAEIYFYLLEADECGAEAGVSIGNITVYSGPSRNNMYDNALCVNYRNKYGNNTTMKDAVSYCFEEIVSVQYSYDQVSEWVSAAENYYNAINNVDNSQNNNDQEGYYDDVKNTGTLTCDAFSNNNYETIHSFNHVETTNENNCITTCEEHVELNFSDPVATQAGMCFQYLIEIKSVVECDSNYVAPPPSRPAVCTPSASCSQPGWWGDAGGPNEDFDSCVMECDGGEYTQSCIDSCYNAVYEEGTYSLDVNNNETERAAMFNPATALLTIDSRPTAIVSQVADSSCIDINSVNYYDSASIQAYYEFRQQDPGGYYNGGTWVPSGNCPSYIAPYYFQSYSMTQRTIGMLRGLYLPYNQMTSYYYANNSTNGFLRSVYKPGYIWDVCHSSCTWVNLCGANTVLTQGQAEAQYQEELRKYEAEKAACESKAATCSNETTEYKIVVDNLDGNDSYNDNDKSDWQEEFNSEQKLNSDKVTGEFPDMVTLVDGSCEDGEDDPWHYHNIITFPGTWINNKTGQTVHSIQPGHEDFYTNIGNEYCTKLNSVPVNTAWYEWKVNQDEKPLTDAEKQAINADIEMNIRGSIDNYGYFGWNFDIECFYALIKDPSDCVGEHCEQSPNPSDPDYPNPDDPSDGGDDGGDGSNGGESPITNFTFRSISLDNLFPSSEAGQTTRDTGFNWSCEATNLENPDYIVQPVALREEIERLGDSIYEGDEYLDYHFVLTPETMNKIRAYNKDVGSYTEPTSTNEEGEGILNAGSNKTSGITVYRSYLIHRTLNSNERLKTGLIGCNNEDNGQCNNTIVDNSCYREYQTASQLLKGGK